MLDRDIVEEFLQEELADTKIEVPSDIDLKALTETFCDYVEDDTSPIYAPANPVLNQYRPKNPKPLPLSLEQKKGGALDYEGYLSAWFTRSFAQNGLKQFIGDYEDYLNFVPTSFNKVMDIFLTHVIPIS